jgi:probable F420-dependent oxidoreductase
MVGFGVMLAQYGSAIEPDTLRAVAQETEAQGWDSLWFGEHIGLPIQTKMDTPGYGEYPVRNDRPWLETLTGLTYLASVTERARLGTCVLAVPWRPPWITAKMLCSIDHLSKGRLIMGLGSGNFHEEFAVVDVPFAERGPRTDEALDAMRVLFTSAEPEFHGKYYNFEGLSFWPKPMQRPLPPTWIGSLKLTLPVRKRIQRFGDGWMATLFGNSPQTITAGISTIGADAAAAGEERQFEICLWAPTRIGEARPDGWVPWEGNLISGTADEVAATYADYIKAGCTHFILCVGGAPPERLRQLRLFRDEILPQLPV